MADLIELPVDQPDGSHAWHLFVIRLRLARMTQDRAAVLQALQGRGIRASVHFIPLHCHPYYQRRWGARKTDFPVADHEYERVISLPIWPGLEAADVDRVVEAFETILTPR